MDVHAVGNEFVVGGQVVLSMPGELCLWCLWGANRGTHHREAPHGAAGPRPQVVWPNGVLASLAIGIFMQLVTPWNENSNLTKYLEYDGNAQDVKESPRLGFMAGKACPHFGEQNSLGDPFFMLTTSMDR